MPDMRLVFWTTFGGIAISLVTGSFCVDELWPRVVVDHRVIEEIPTAADEPSERTLMSPPSAHGRQTAMPAGAGLGWPTLLGPNHDGTSPETGLDLEWSEEEPPEKWRIEVGTGYAGPVALGDAVVLLHRKGDGEVAECLDPETGQTRWEHAWPASYACPYNHSSGPYAAPVLEGNRVYAIGAGGDLYCLNLDDGIESWHRSLHKDYDVEIEVWPVSASTTGCCICGTRNRWSASTCGGRSESRDARAGEKRRRQGFALLAVSTSPCYQVRVLPG